MNERLAILLSGGGTTMQEIIKTCQSGELPLEIACIISSNPGAGGISRARNLHIPEKDIIIIDPNTYHDEFKKVNQQQFGQKILEELQQRSVTVVTQNGWLPLTPENVIKKFEGRIFNQHPGPVPEFGGKGMYGRRVHAARLLFARLTKRDLFTFAIAQRVGINFDEGAVVESQEIEILPTDTVDDLQSRTLPIEHTLQVQLLKDFLAGTLVEKTLPSFVKGDEQQLLEEVKKMARALYPFG